MQVEIFETPPKDFQSVVEAVGAYLEIDGRLLLLQYADFKEAAGRWNVPGGRVDEGETAEEAVRRELFEETGIRVERESTQNLGTLYIRESGTQYIYQLFRIALDQKPEVRLSSEHQQYQWASLAELESLPLVRGAYTALRKYWTALSQRKGAASVNVYLLLKRGEEVLLSFRQNTGYLDHHWGFPAGHVEAGESATAGMIREAKEEIGIEIAPEDLKTVHVMHRKTNRLNIDIFFECSRWQGDIENREPKKCGGLEFFPRSALPYAIVESNAFVLESRVQGQLYSEWGFS